MSSIKSTTNYLLNKYLVKGILYHVPFLGKKIRNYEELKQIARDCGYKPGHFYSPIPSRDEVNDRADIIFKDRGLLDIDLNAEEQFKLLKHFKIRRSEFPYDFLTNRENNKLRYKFTKRPQYRYSDVIFLFNTMLYVKPKKIIEIGSGASSAVMLDINDLFFDSSIDCTFIEPYPERLLTFLNEDDRKYCSIKKEKVQDVPIETFTELEKNDILFVDSSHVSKVGSDLNHILFEIFPRLKKGVWIHIHDIFYPFELPKHWILNNSRFWNESYLLRAFLMNNDAYEIKLFNSFLHNKFNAWFEKELPECLIDKNNTGSIWIKKVTDTT